MDIWNRARSFAEEAAKKSQELRQTIAASNLADVVSEASKRSKELAAEALKRADQITAQIPTAAPKTDIDPADLEKYGVTDELREFVKEITMNTFQDFPLEGFATLMYYSLNDFGLFRSWLLFCSTPARSVNC